MRLIDSDELITILRENLQKDRSVTKVLLVGFAKQILDDAPTVDAEPVKHGKWVRIDEFTIKCSMCNQGGIFASDWEYCPLCGAKMDEVTE